MLTNNKMNRQDQGVGAEGMEEPTQAELMVVISRMNNSTATGVDDLAVELLKYGGGDRFLSSIGCVTGRAGTCLSTLNRRMVAFADHYCRSSSRALASQRI